MLLETYLITENKKEEYPSFILNGETEDTQNSLIYILSPMYKRTLHSISILLLNFFILLCFNKPSYDLITLLERTKSLLSSHKSTLHCYWILWDVFGFLGVTSIILYQNSFIFLCFKNINSSFSVTKIIKFYAVTNVWIENLLKTWNKGD